eukprot:Blabericola_migrator_1__6866@NODE_3478_length_1738_cov_13_943148_g2163_i0_p2_GENE_NODE_3478_length_1738_cov_13_943148_g2163_i0NODE_3478_length_1738_cov_13_943148_g2163_i0_p2_ORF_typecomplete_len145_score5_25DUF4209/PF13910_6/0_11DUF4110/PF13422_6/0_3_NODE_3478_length_1738_cov_13_943148_g2163_i0234668
MPISPAPDVSGPVRTNETRVFILVFTYNTYMNLRNRSVQNISTERMTATSADTQLEPMTPLHTLPEGVSKDEGDPPRGVHHQPQHTGSGPVPSSPYMATTDQTTVLLMKLIETVNHSTNHNGESLAEYFFKTYDTWFPKANLYK